MTQTKYEIERRFLVDVDALGPLLHDRVPCDTFYQGYLHTDPCLRVRVGGQQAWITVKGEGVTKREEYEMAISERLGRAFLPSCKNVIEKKRWTLSVPEGNGVRSWTVDVFAGALQGLVMAEVELRAEDEAIALPSWIAAEVTHDRAYTNLALGEAQKIPESYTRLLRERR